MNDDEQLKQALVQPNRKAKTMTKTKRFVVTGDRNIIDTLNLAKSPNGYCHQCDPEDDIYLRERVLSARLGDLVGDLIIDPPRDRSGLPGKKSSPFDPVRHSIWWMLCTAIRASRLNGQKVDVSIKNRFNGTLKRQKDGLLGQTSISLFVDDVECLLRDLYGDIEMEVFDDILLAVRTIVKEFTEYTCRDLWEEYSNAVISDTMVGIGVPQGCGISSSDCARGRKALSDLMKRSRAVLESKSDFSQYTVKFATYCDEHFYPPSEAIDDDLRS
jgi:hypothetical protein